MIRTSFAFGGVALVSALGFAFATLSADSGNSKNEKPAWDAIATNDCPNGFSKPSQHCAPTVTGAFDADGRLWLAWPNDGHVYINATANGGKTFTAPVRVNKYPQSIDNNGENRPKLVIGPQGDIYVTYTIHAKQKYTGDVLFSRSLDGGKTFDAPRSINDGKTKSSLRFETLGINDDGELTLTWLDKRDLFAAKAEKTPYAGSAIYYTTSKDRGATFGPNTLLAHHTCECCRIAMDMENGRNPVMVWRHIFDGIRDHAVARINDDGRPSEIGRHSVDNWAIETCPHHGPSISIDDDGIFHTTWYTAGELRQGPFYARSTDSGKTFAEILEIGSDGGQAEHPFTLSTGGVVYVAWKDFDGERTRFRVMASKDKGITWGPGRVVATSTNASDHPLLISHDEKVYATWRTADTGFHVIDITGE
ncbi:MAG: glycoside hydrolase [Rhodospirillaceae bacterium]|nr:glycoside hydrolase [Rhodospirillaceae bacterium]